MLVYDMAITWDPAFYLENLHAARAAIGHTRSKLPLRTLYDDIVARVRERKV